MDLDLGKAYSVMRSVVRQRYAFDKSTTLPCRPNSSSREISFDTERWIKGSNFVILAVEKYLATAARRVRCSSCGTVVKPARGTPAKL